MKILFVTTLALEYNASANIRNRALVAGLLANGHDVALLSIEPQPDALRYEKVTLFPTLSRCEIPLKKVQARASQTKADSSVISKIKRFLSALFRRFAIYDSRVTYAKDAAKIQLDGHYDALISSSDPKSAHRIAEALIRANSDRVGCWIQYWGDPFAGDINLEARHKIRKAHREEARLLALADRVVYTSPVTLEAVKKAYDLPENKAVFIPTPYEKPRVYPPTGHETFRSLLYAGDYRKDRDITPLYNAVRENRNLRLSIVGESDIELEPRDNISLSGRVSVAQLSKLEEEADALVCLLNKHGTQIPGKAFHDAATNRPILMLYEESSRAIVDYFRRTGRYILVPNKKDAIADVLTRLDALCREPWAPYEPFSAESAAARFIDLVKSRH